MAQYIQRNIHRTLFTIILLSSFVYFTACKISLVSDYDSNIVTQIEQTSKKVDIFYLEMLEKTQEDKNGRTYETFVDQYISIQVELNALLNKNKVKPLNENSTRICEITLELWQKYKEEHKKDNTLSNALIKLNRKTFNDLFYAMLVAENGKKIINNPPK